MGLAERKPTAKKGKKKEPTREKRIAMEIVVDAYDAWEQAMSWYHYLEDKLKFPFPATCFKKRGISPLKLNEKVEVVGMPLIDECEQEMFVSLLWECRRFAVPLDQLRCEGRDKITKQAVEDWHYWMAQGYQFG
jgi:hypothetical protein